MKKWLFRVLCVTVATLFAVIFIACNQFAPGAARTVDRAVADSAARSVSQTRSYLLIFDENGAPADLEQQVSLAGGNVTERFDGYGFAVATSADPTFAKAVSRVSGLTGVAGDAMIRWLPEDSYASQSIGNDEPFFAYQWNMEAINAAGAWNAGYTGAGARVAVLDTGIDPDHPDLVDNVNTDLSTSFVPDEPFIEDLDGHGTHVAGIIAAEDNGIGTIGVAPSAEIVAVKVLNGSGVGDFSWILAGCIYAADVAHANVINMSLEGILTRRGFYDETGAWVSAREVSQFTTLITRVINRAWANGTVVVAAAGNDSHNGTGDAGEIHAPADMGRTLSISATGPLGWGFDQSVNLDTPAFYTNYGSSVDLAAPGGNVDFDIYPNDGWWYDMVLSTYADGGYAWAAGTSMASPHVAGVAALIIGAHGGNITPSQVESILRKTADDLGKPGRDQWYGHGRINAAHAAIY